MNENIPIRKLASKLSLKAIWGIISSIVIVVSGAISAGYQLGSFFYATTICHVEICAKEKEITDLNSQKIDLKGQVLNLTEEVGKCKIVVFTLQQKDKELEPIIKLLLENYEATLKDPD